MFHLVCRVPFHGYEKGQMVTDPAEVNRLLTSEANGGLDRDHHFVRIAAPPAKAEDKSE